MNNETYPDRLMGIDFSKGYAMFVIIVTHLFNYWGIEHLQSVAEGTAGDSPLIFKIIMFLLIWQGSWAAIFSFIAGANAAYTIHFQVKEKGADFNSRIKKSVINGIIILLVNFIYSYFSVYPMRDLVSGRQQGLFPMSIKEGKYTPPNNSVFFIASPLSMIAWSTIIIALVLYLIWRNGIKKEKNKQYRIILLIIGIIFIYVSEPLRNLILPFLEDSMENQRFFSAMVLAWFFGSKHCVFPFAGYAFIGAAMILYLRDAKPDFKGMKRFIIISSLFFFVVAFVSTINSGIPPIEEWYGTYHPFFSINFNLFGIIIWVGGSILIFDRIPKSERVNHRRYKPMIIFQRLSLISLTIFLIEQTTAAIYAVITTYIFPEYIYSNTIFIFFWTVLYTYAWILMINYWDKNGNFRFSIEWFLVCFFAKKK